MATIVRRTGKDGHTVYLVRVRRKGTPPQTATFAKFSEAKKWAQITEGAVLEGRHFKTSEAKHHTISDLLARYRQEVFPQKRSSTVYNQIYHLQWWEAQLGHCALSEITPALIVEYRDKLARTRKNSTVRRVTVQVVKTGMTPQRAPSERLREAETVPLHPAGRLHTRQ